ncbi:hypothetical protein KR018_003495 [Drosophila ironensis]|nr:hypothetical protein KR018_003495 [Drosophila ironensis]
METGCPAASSESSDIASASSSSSRSRSRSRSRFTSKSASNRASTSRRAAAAAAAAKLASASSRGDFDFASMSTLRDDVEADVCVSANSQHGFAVVLDDESSTFEISSSNSLPASAGAASTVGVVAVDDSSSTDTINGGGDSAHRTGSCDEHSQGFFNAEEEPPVVCLINDDDEDEDDQEPEDPEEDEDEELIEEEDGDEDVVDLVVAAIDCPNTSQLPLPDGTIMAADGSKIFLETPVVEEAQPHPHPHPHPDQMLPQSELAGKPKRLSDEFLLVEDAEQAANQQQEPQQSRGIKSDPENPETCLHDRLMSVRLKQMTLTAGTAANPSPAASAVVQEEASTSSSSSSSNSSSALSRADIESMDLIERRDFETEQRLTGGIILRNSSMMSQNKLNLSLMKSMAGSRASGAAASGVGSDDWPSSSNGRTVSSDSKCTYKDLSTTPTSSRKYTNSRLSKSTAKLNLGSSLARDTSSCSQHRSGSGSGSGSVSGSNANGVGASSSSSFTLKANPETFTGAARTDVFTNTNSNDYPGLATGSVTSSSTSTSTSTCQQEQGAAESADGSVTYSSVGSQTSQEGGCSRTTAHSQTSACLGDGQASTSSGARASCNRSTARQVNASAQTQERFLARSNLAATSTSTASGSSQQRRRNGSNDVVHLEVVVEEGAAGVGGGGDNNHVEPGDFSGEEPWGNCDEENNCSDLEEICTCQNGNGNSFGGSSASLNESYDLDTMDHEDNLSLSLCASSASASAAGIADSSLNTAGSLVSMQRKRKYYESRLMDGDYSLTIASSGGLGGSSSGDNCRKRIAYDFASTPRSSQHSGPTAVASHLANASPASLSGLGRRTPRSMSTRDNPPPEMQHWLAQFQRWSHAERLVAVDRLIDHCDASQVRHMMKVIEPQFQRDFISLLPREMALFVLSYLEPRDLLRAAQTCRSWRYLCDDNLLWKEKCRKAQILAEPRSDRPKRGRDGNMPPIASPWKAAYMRQHIIEMNWRQRPVRKPKVLKGHDDHVITCLQFSGNRIVSGSDDNTLKVWSAVNGKCLRTLVGHTGGVWSSQMSGNIIISGSTDRTLKVWDMDSGACVHTLQGHTSTVRCMHLHGNKVVSGSRDATLRVWDIEQGSCLHVLVGHLAAVRCVQYDGKLIVSGAYDYMVKIWHPERQECLHTLQGHTNRVYSLQFDGLHVVSGSLDTSIRVWDVETGNCKHTLMGHQSLTSGMELRQNILVSGNADSTVKVWDITTGQCLQTLSGTNKHQSAVTCLQFNSRFVVTSSDDGTVKLWDVKTGEFIRNLVALDSGGSGGVVWRIRANDTKLICAVGSRNGTEETKLMVLDFDVEGACVKCS